MNLSRYLERIGFQGSIGVTADTLAQVQTAHMLTVPFENLSILAGEPIVLEEEKLYGKIVERRRGGFCYELNGLLAWALRQMGFEVRMLSAGVLRPNGVYGPEFDHMVLGVTLEEEWLVDVGFGDSFRRPLRLDGGEQGDGFSRYRLESDEAGQRVLMKNGAVGEWRAQYRFGRTPRVLGDYAEMCVWQQTSPESFFRKNRLCSLATVDGRLTLSGNRLITTQNGVKTERDISDEAEAREVLRKDFRVVME